MKNNGIKKINSKNKVMYKFLVYKLYHFAKMQEESASVRIVFLAYISLFEFLHLMIVDNLILEIFGYGLLGYSEFIHEYFRLLFIVIGFSLNYFIFIRTRLIYKIYDYYQTQSRTNWKDNLLFLLYMLIMSILFFILVETKKGGILSNVW